MKLSAALILASAFGMTNAFFNFRRNDEGKVAFRPRVSDMLDHLEKNGQLSWTPHELGNGVMVANYSMDDWNNARAYLSSANWTEGDSSNSIERRVPQSQGQSQVSGSALYPQFDDPIPVTATVTVTAASGTTSVPMADNTNHASKWVCRLPYNIPVSLGQSAASGIICQYIFPFLQTRFTGGQDTMVQNTYSLPASALGGATRAVRVLVHIEKNWLWPGLKSALCTGMLQNIAGGIYCWAYGEDFSTSSRIKRQTTDTALVGGTVWIYDTTNTAAAGLIEIETVADD